MLQLSLKNKKRILYASLSVLAIAAAVLCSILATWTRSAFVRELAYLVHYFLYFALFTLWGVSVHRRIIQLQARLHFVVVAVLMVLWLTLREFRLHLAYSENISRLCWYSYYIPILLILVLSFFISLSLGKSEKYRLSKWTSLMFLPTLLLIVLVLTNDLHQWVFIVPATNLMQSRLDYQYGFLFYLLALWCGICILATFLILFVKSRILQTGRFLWLPLVPIFIATLYAIIYITRFPVLGWVLGDVTLFNCLLFMAFFESCIQCGLIQTNTCYVNIFKASLNLSAQITDRDYNVCYAAHDAQPIRKEDMFEAEQGLVILEDGRRVHNISVYGGHAIWTEDIFELLELRQSLAEAREDLRERNEFLKNEYEQEREYRRVMEKNRLYDLLQRETQVQLDKVSVLAAEYEGLDDEAEKRRILAKIVILGSYIKRRKDFVLQMEGASMTEGAFMISENRLKSALDESFRSLKLAGIKGAYVVDTGAESLKGDIILLAYDFFENVLESVLDRLRYIAVRVALIEGRLRCAVLLDCEPGMDELSALYPGLQVIRPEDGGVELMLPLTGGVEL